ncbi:hypothetical protein [Brevibacterium luteolum]|uniref:hypothetical protein n=1 Tax=Brevibacterium luteolum TaxID=199591 RepID=UPI00223BC2A7|nr:hypothetical protein [Brevibacterium luteolum]MCT1830351.1 hypothetical protein [Brevibacterium luteolum]
MTRPLTTETIEGLFDIASRAPSAHNTQPWLPRLLEITGAGARIRVRTDPERTLPVGDEHGADLGMSLGCWVEACAIAAAEEDLRLRELTVTGARHDVTITFLLTPAGAEPAGGAAPVADAAEPSDAEVSAGFSVAEVLTRQVDRGRLRRDTAAVEAAVAEYAALRPQAILDRTAHGEVHRQEVDDRISGIVIAQVPEAIWVKAARYAQSAPFEPREAFDETLRWLRLDDRDPRYQEDGLTAETLRLPRRTSRLAARLLGGDEAPDEARDRLRDMLVTAGAWSTMLPTFIARRAPDRLALAIEARHPSEVSAERWVLLGRELMRLWLVFARHGLRVSVESQLKDVQLPAAMLADVLRRTAPARNGGKPVYQPFTTFSVGRSTGPVPRSPRLR